MALDRSAASWHFSIREQQQIALALMISFEMVVSAVLGQHPRQRFLAEQGRNTVIGPGLANVDLNATKVFPITERVKLNFRVEFYNLLNRANFALPGNQIFSSNGSINPAAGVITSTITTSRQLQFGVKIVF